ncbi:MAG: hypothetical protein WAO00_06395 [Chthoniobacterales bacterium]
MNAHKTLRITKAKSKLAAGILGQARRDLRRFHGATRATERELYLDAYSWVISENSRWPFSFLNVCRLLDLAPDELRRDLLSDVTLGVCQYWSRRFGTALRQYHLSLRQALLRQGRLAGAEIGTLIHGLS